MNTLQKRKQFTLHKESDIIRQIVYIIVLEKQKL